MKSKDFREECIAYWKARVGDLDTTRLEKTLDTVLKKAEDNALEEAYPRLLSLFKDKLDGLRQTTVGFATNQRANNVKYSTRLDDIRSTLPYFMERLAINSEISKQKKLGYAWENLLNIAESEARQKDHADNYPYLTIDKGIADKAQKISLLDVWKEHFDDVYLFYTEPTLGYYKSGNKWIVAERDTKVILDKAKECGAKVVYINNIIKDKIQQVQAYARSLDYDALPLLADATKLILQVGANSRRSLVYLNGGGYNSIDFAAKLKTVLPNSVILIVHSKNGRQRNGSARTKYLTSLGLPATSKHHYNDIEVIKAIQDNSLGNYTTDAVAYENGWLLVIKERKKLTQEELTKRFFGNEVVTPTLVATPKERNQKPPVPKKAQIKLLHQSGKTVSEIYKILLESGYNMSYVKLYNYVYALRKGNK